MAAILLGTVSCSDGTVYSEAKETNPAAWAIADEVQFEADIDAGTYRMDLLVRSNEQYAFQNLWLFVDTKIGNTLMKTDTIEGYLSDNFGRRTGQGIGSKRTNMFVVSDSVVLADTTYRFTVRHGMRTDQLIGITDIGIVISNK